MCCILKPLKHYSVVLKENDMPKFLEKKLKKQYGSDSAVPYKIMNKLGFMRGSKETAKGKAASKKHSAKMRGMGGSIRRKRMMED